MPTDPIRFSVGHLAEAPRRLDSQAHVWLARPEVAHCPKRRQHYEDVLSASERERYSLFHFEHNRLEYLVAHALVRITLSRYAPIEPRDWSFKYNHYGRPEIAGGDGTLGLRFNLSHTKGLVACIVTNALDCGIDVEYERPLDDLTELASTVFSTNEQASLNLLPIELQLGRFYTLWTLKEAYIKARGLGLSLPLQEFSFELEEAASPSLEIADSLEDDPDMWQILTCQATQMHKLAVALRRGRTSNLRVVCRFVVP